MTVTLAHLIQNTSFFADVKGQTPLRWIWQHLFWPPHCANSSRDLPNWCKCRKSFCCCLNWGVSDKRLARSRVLLDKQKLKKTELSSGCAFLNWKCCLTFLQGSVRQGAVFALVKTAVELVNASAQAEEIHEVQMYLLGLQDKLRTLACKLSYLIPPTCNVTRWLPTMS